MLLILHLGISRAYGKSRESVPDNHQPSGKGLRLHLKLRVWFSRRAHNHLSRPSSIPVPSCNNIISWDPFHDLHLLLLLDYHH